MGSQTVTASAVDTVLPAIASAAEAVSSNLAIASSAETTSAEAVPSGAESVVGRVEKVSAAVSSLGFDFDDLEKKVRLEMWKLLPLWGELT